MILILGLYAVLALTFVIAQQAVQACSPLLFIAIRMIISGIILLSYVGFCRKKQVVPQRADWRLFGLVTLLHIYCAFTLEFWALKEVTGLKANFLYALTPFIAFAIDRLWTGKKGNPARLLGIIIGFCGLMPLLGVHAQSISFTVTRYDAALLGSVISAASAWFFIKLLFDRGYSILIINGWSMLLGGILSLCTAFVGEHMYIADAKTFFLCLSSLILLSNVIVYTLYGTLVKRYSLTLITTAGFLCPLFGLLYDWLFFGVVPNILYIPALICITIGLVLVHAHEKK